MVDRHVFQFRSIGYLEKLTGKKANNLDELIALIKSCPDSSIFYHTFSALRKMREVHAPYTSDFALWISGCLNEEALSEKLGAINLREYNTIETLRARIIEIVESYRDLNPAVFQRQADDPFYLCDVTKIVYLTDKFAYDLRSFREMLGRITTDCIFYHFIESRLQNELHLDDFSTWLDESLKLGELAGDIRNIDINVNSLSDIGSKINGLISQHLDTG